VLDHVVELACGHGRHSEKVAKLCGKLILMDIHQANLNACRGRLQTLENVDYNRNSGDYIQPIPDGLISAVFCYDAMVHFSPDLVESYLNDTARILTPKGRALFHHSNYDAPTDQHYGRNPHARNRMTLERFRTCAEQAGLMVITSTPHSWGGVSDLDGVTLVEKT